MVIHYYPTQQRKASQPLSAAKATPTWGWVYSLLALLVLLLWVERRQPLTRGGHLTIQCGIVLVVYGLIFLWLHVNQAALYAERATAKTKVTYVIYVATPNVAVAEPLAQSHNDPAGMKPAPMTPLIAQPMHKALGSKQPLFLN